MQPDQSCGIALKHRKIRRLRGGAPAERNDGRPPKRFRLAQSARQLFVFELAESRLALAFKYFRDGMAGGIRDALVEIHVQPSDLARKQACNRGFPGTHESCEAKKLARAIVWWSGRRIFAVGVQSDAALFAPVDVDCTIERFQLDFGFALVVHAEQSLRES